MKTPRKQATITSVRAPFYRRVYSTLIASLEQNDALRGKIARQIALAASILLQET